MDNNINSNHAGQNGHNNHNINYDRESNILVIDDDQTLLKFFKIHLNKFFSKVVVVHSAMDGMAVLKEKKFDLVISDIRMPRVDGLQLITKVKKVDITIPVFLISGAMLTDEQNELVKVKADGYLRKPFSVDQLHDFIETGLRVREIYKNMYKLLPDKQKLKKLMKAGASVKNIKDDNLKHEVEKLSQELKKVS
ncbi:MAG: response regulator [Oligoflexales bacterium]|nr:response regulator [Oligoflexales bacterium]